MLILDRQAGDSGNLPVRRQARGQCSGWARNAQRLLVATVIAAGGILAFCIVATVRQLPVADPTELLHQFVAFVVPPRTEAPRVVGNPLLDFGGAIPLFHIMFGVTLPMPMLTMASIGSCRHFYGNDRVKHIIVDDANIDEYLPNRHPSFYLMSKVHKSDYARSELLYAYGGIYMDTDNICLSSVDVVAVEAAARSTGGVVLDGASANGFASNLMGPFTVGNVLSEEWHAGVWARLDGYTPALQRCRVTHADGAGGVAYPTRELSGDTVCGVGWGVFVDPGFTAWGKLRAQLTYVNPWRQCGWGESVNWGVLVTPPPPPPPLHRPAILDQRRESGGGDDWRRFCECGGERNV